MKVLDPKLHAKILAQRVVSGHALDSFGGTTQMEAALDEETIDELKMRKALERFGRALAAQYNALGVELHTISFSLITDEPNIRAD